MADFLTIDATPWLVQTQAAAIKFVKVGTVTRAFDGTLRSSRRDQFFESEGFRTIPLTPAVAATFVALDDGALHTVSGDVFGGASLQALVEIDAMEMISNGLGFLVIHRFTLRVT